MTPTWYALTVGLTFVFAVCGVRGLRGDAMERLVGVQLASTTLVAWLLVAAVLLERSFYIDLALWFVLLSLAGCLTYARLMTRWL